jgi:hypothetical protein
MRSNVMIESLGPLVSLFKLLVEGISKSAKAIKSSKNRAIKRKLIEIQLSLEDIIDNAEYLLSLIENSIGKTQKENRELVDGFKKALYKQLERLRIFMDQITDNTSEEILKIFAPGLRRNILILTQRKMSAVNWVLSSMYDTIQKTTVSKNGLNAIIQSELIRWDHQRFVNEGQSYWVELSRSSKRAKVLLSDHLKEQKEIIKSLNLCSKDFSEFIKEHISIQETIGLVSKKIR